jgi:alkylation response protein AidB-like acyl-CoA dehydrogenase
LEDFEKVVPDIFGSFKKELRDEVKAFLTKNKPPDISPERNLSQFVSQSLKWQKMLFEAKLLGTFLPLEYGGRNLSLMDEAVILETLALNDCPQLAGIFGITMLAPTLLKFGSQQQKETYLKKIFTGEDLWCQGFSEPSAGTDLANLSTKLETVDGHFKLFGQKIWTSFAEFATGSFLLAKLPGSQPKHEQIVFCLAQFSTQAKSSSQVIIRPIEQITGEKEFCEIFFDGLEIWPSDIVGDLGQGWKIAMYLLQVERSLLTFARHTQTIKLIRKIWETANYGHDLRNFGSEFTALVSEFNSLRVMAYWHLELLETNRQLPGQSSIDKLMWSENFKKLARLYYRFCQSYACEQTEEAEKLYLYSLGRTIAAGTSEIQKLTIAQRLLGLPKSY